MNVVVINGLKITTNMRYVKFTKGTKDSISESKVSDCFSVEFSEGRLAKDIAYRNVCVVNPNAILQETDYIKIYNALVKINGLVIKNITSQEYQWSQFIVADIKDFVMNYSEESCTILIPKLKETNVVEYEKLLMKNPYIELVDDTDLHSLTNIYGFQFYRTNVEINSTNSFVFNQSAYYTRYLLRDIDVVQSFLNQLRTILTEYGMSLHRYPIDETTQTIDRVIYRVTEYGKQESRKTNHLGLRDAIQHTSKIDFEATFLNNDMLDDFITRYQNVDLISDFTMFYTKDKNGMEWISNVKWEPVTTDRQAEYNTDGQGNSGISCQFSCQIGYYVVYDKVYRAINKIIMDIVGSEYPNGNDVPIDNKEIGEGLKGTDPMDDVTMPDFEKELSEWEKLRQ